MLDDSASRFKWLLVVGVMAVSGHMVSLLLQGSLDLFVWWLQSLRNGCCLRPRLGTGTPLFPRHCVAKSQNQVDTQGRGNSFCPLWEELQSQSAVKVTCMDAQMNGEF